MYIVKALIIHNACVSRSDDSSLSEQLKLSYVGSTSILLLAQDMYTVHTSSNYVRMVFINKGADSTYQKYILQLQYTRLLVHFKIYNQFVTC